MKKIVAILVIGAALLMLVVPTFAEPAPKLTLCHITDTWDVPHNGWTVAIGEWITVSENALLAHFAHGDFPYAENNNIDSVGPIFGLTWRQVAENVGLDPTYATCAGFIPD